MIAESFARIFFRNAVAIGLPVLPCPGAAQSFQEGDEAEIDIFRAAVKNISAGTALQGPPLPKDILEIISQGGTLSLLKALAEKERLKNQ